MVFRTIATVAFVCFVGVGSFTPHGTALSTMGKRTPSRRSLSFFQSLLPRHDEKRNPPGYLPLRATTVSPSASSTTETSRKKLQSLVKDLIEISNSNGARSSIRRTLQATIAIQQLSLELVGDIVDSSRPGVTPPIILRRLFEKLGSTYVKLGQFIASSPTIFPKEYVQEFQKCLDSTEPIDFSIIEGIIRKEGLWGNYEWVDPVPLASASIAQVHKARLKGGIEVVLKVRKPEVGEIIGTDMSFLLACSKILEFLNPEFERTSLSGIVSDIRSSMQEETDFQLEASNTRQFRSFLEREGLLDRVYAPKVYEEFTSKQVMTMEFLDGVSLLDAQTVEKVKGVNKSAEELVITALNVWTESVLREPFFHADVHAGNLLVMKDGRVAFIDFGIVGRINPSIYNAVIELSTSLAARDYTGMAKALANMGATDGDVNIPNFAKDIEAVLQSLLGLDVNIEIGTGEQGVASVGVGFDDNEVTRVLLDIVNVTERNGLRLPREFGLLVKQSLYFDRYLKILAPDVDIVADERVKLGTDQNLGGRDGDGGGVRLSGDEVIDV